MFLSTQKLKSLRQEKGWSQEVVAKASGLSVRTIQRIEADGKASSESTLALASVYDLSPKALQATSPDIKATWRKNIIMKNTIALLVISAVISMLIWLGADFYLYLDLPSVLFIVLFLYSATVVCFGFNGMTKSLKGLKYLFTDEMLGGRPAQYLALVYQSQVKFCYGAAGVGFFIGLIAINGNIDTYDGFVLHRAFAVNLLMPMYAVLLAEAILRPLAIKLSTCDLSQ